MGATARAVAPLSRLQLTWVFLRMGALAVGDTGPLLAMIERDLVAGRGVLSREDVTEALTYTKALPGSTVVQIVAYLAYKLGGWSGSALATIAYILPSAVLMALIAAGYVALTALPWLKSATEGLTAAAVGLLLATAWRLGRRAIDPRQPVSVALALAALAAGLLLGINAAVVVVAAGLVGVLVYTKKEATAAP